MSGCVELDLNEMPYPPPDNVVSAAGKNLTSLNRYTDPDAHEKLAVLLAEYTGVSSEQIIIGPGSDVLLRETVLCFAGRRKMVIPNPTFLPTKQMARRFARKLVSIRLSAPEFSLALGPLLEELTEPSLIIIDNPNNPTARLLLDREMVETILAMPDMLLVVDEAYFEFSGLTFANMVATHDNLALARTLDKAFSLAGARIGYLVAGRIFLDALSRSFTFLPQPSLQAATEALLSPGYMWKNVQSIVHERERLSKELEMLGARVFPSNTNFLLARSEIRNPAGELQEKGVHVMDASTQLGPGYIRVAVGTREDNEAFLRVYRSMENKRKVQESLYEYSNRSSG
jgi:histidinol-phosphate aminotransferase